MDANRRQVLEEAQLVASEAEEMYIKKNTALSVFQVNIIKTFP
jgi:hypothetical protein